MSIGQSRKHESEEVKIVRKTVVGDEAGYGGAFREGSFFRLWTETKGAVLKWIDDNSMVTDNLFRWGLYEGKDRQ
jgi:hypothetical protein